MICEETEVKGERTAFFSCRFIDVLTATDLSHQPTDLRPITTMILFVHCPVLTAVA